MFCLCNAIAFFNIACTIVIGRLMDSWYLLLDLQYVPFNVFVIRFFHFFIFVPSYDWVISYTRTAFCSPSLPPSLPSNLPSLLYEYLGAMTRSYFSNNHWCIKPFHFPPIPSLVLCYILFPVYVFNYFIIRFPSFCMLILLHYSYLSGLWSWYSNSIFFAPRKVFKIPPEFL